MTHYLPHLPLTLSLLTRFSREYQRLWKTLIFRDLLDRLLFLLAFGFGMGGVIRGFENSSYLAFLVPGIAAMAGVMVMTMAMTFGAYERFSSYKLWQSWLATPARLPDVLLAELLYAASRAMPPVVILFVLAYTLGALPHVWAAFAVLPIIFFANLTLGAIALCFTTHIRRHLHFAYVQTLWTTPMYLFSGVFFDLSQTPPAMQAFATILPLTHVLNLVRPLMLEGQIDLRTLFLSAGALILAFVAAFIYAARRFHKRLEA